MDTETAVNGAYKIADQLPVVFALIVIVAGFLWYMWKRDRNNQSNFKDQADRNQAHVENMAKDFKGTVEGLSKTFKDSLQAQSDTFGKRADECHQMQARSLDVMEEATKSTTELRMMLESLKRE